MGNVDLEERVARLEAELSLLKYQNRLKNDSLLARMARRWTRMEEFNVGNPVVRPNSFMWCDKEGVEANENFNLTSNMVQGGPNYAQLLNASYNGWWMRMGGTAEGWSVIRQSTTDNIPETMAVIGPTGGKSGGTLALYCAPANLGAAIALGWSGNAPTNAIRRDTAGNVQLGNTVDNTNVVCAANWFDVSGTTGTTGGIAMKSKAGAPTDADFTNPVNAMMAIDTTNNKIYVRIGGVWKSVGVA